MNAATNKKIEYAAYFAFGTFAALAFNFFMHQNVVLGIVSAVIVSLAALYLRKEAVMAEMLALKRVPERFMAVVYALGAELSSAREAVKEAIDRSIRDMRQKRVLRRNRIFRTRRLLSA